MGARGSRSQDEGEGKELKDLIADEDRRLDGKPILQSTPISSIFLIL